MIITDDKDIARLLNTTRTIALIGASDKEDRASYRVMGFLLSHGYTVWPVNPQLAGKLIHGQTVHATLADLPSAPIWWTFSAIRTPPDRSRTRRLPLVPRPCGCSWR
jgi:predicted CoA-binding protein